MKLNMYERTPKWIKILRIIMCVIYIPFELFMIVAAATEDLLVGLVVLMVVLLLDFGIAAMIYNSSKAYMEIEGKTIYITDYPFFKERKWTASLRDIKEIKYHSYRGSESLVFKSHKNKFLFSTGNLPEIRYYFIKLGFEIKY